MTFQKPKKDRCDTCEENAKKTPEVEAAQQIHITKKNESRRARKEDRETKDQNIAVVCFDFGNVFALPRAEVSNFFYKRKMSSYNLTAHVNLNNTAYSAVWHEGVTGRNANCIASALRKILEKVLIDLPHIQEIVLWSDSCVPQNRNQVMTTCLKYFIRDNPQIQRITQEFSEPGHGTIQEVDAIHSKIERFLVNREVFSHLGLIKLFVKLSKMSDQKMETIMMQKTDFFNYQSISKQFNYNRVPYTKIKISQITSDKPYYVQYAEDHSYETLKSADISAFTKTKKGKLRPLLFPDDIPLIEIFEEIAPKKKKDLQSMYKYMPAIDVQFYKAFIK